MNPNCYNNDSKWNYNYAFMNTNLILFIIEPQHKEYCCKEFSSSNSEIWNIFLYIRQTYCQT